MTLVKPLCITGKPSALLYSGKVYQTMILANILDRPDLDDTYDAGDDLFDP